MKAVKRNLIVLFVGMSLAPSALALETPVAGPQLGQLPQGRVGTGAWKCQLAEDHNARASGGSVAQKAAPIQAKKGNTAINGG